MSFTNLYTYSAALMINNGIFDGLPHSVTKLLASIYQQKPRANNAQKCEFQREVETAFGDIKPGEQRTASLKDGAKYRDNKRRFLPRDAAGKVRLQKRLRTAVGIRSLLGSAMSVNEKSD